MWPAPLEPWGRACRRRVPSNLAEGPVGVDGRGGIKGGPEPRRSSGDGSAQCRGPLRQEESRDFEGVQAGCTLSPCPLQTTLPHQEVLSPLRPRHPPPHSEVTGAPRHHPQGQNTWCPALRVRRASSTAALSDL